MRKAIVNTKLTKAEKFFVTDLYEIILSTGTNPELMMQTLSSVLREYVGAREIVLFEYQESDQYNHRIISHVKMDKGKEKSFLSLADYTHTSSDTILSYDYFDNEVVGELLGELDYKDVVIIPILGSQERIGCLHVFGKLESGHDDHLIRLILSIRGLLGLILENYKFYNQLDQYDALTGLYRRKMISKKYKALSEYNENIGILLADINGLKLLNDTLGFATGDTYLRELARLLIEVTGDNKYLFRVGDDEFAYLFTGREQTNVNEVIKNLNKAIEQLNIDELEKFPLTISTGYAIEKCVDCNFEMLYSKAEKNLNQDKLLHSESKKSDIVRTLTKALEARDFITEGHADRMEKLLDSFAKVMDFDNVTTNKLRLFGKFHDIGKVGVADKILFKPGRLNEIEMAEMKKHSEMGYKIALTAADLHAIAELILRHHEYFNGSGYPFGLAGENIPLECRILAIVDAFDAMTNDRPYRKAMLDEKAVEELIKNKGKQFDPELVDIFIKDVLR